MNALKMACLTACLLLATGGSVSAYSDMGRASDFQGKTVDAFFLELCNDDLDTKRCKEDFPEIMDLLNRIHVTWHKNIREDYMGKDDFVHDSESDDHQNQHKQWDTLFVKKHKGIHTELNTVFGPEFQQWHVKADELLGSHESWHNHLLD